MSNKCHVCKKSFSTPSSLTRHIRAAHASDNDEGNPQQKYACDRCPKVFVRQETLIRHQGLHDGYQSACVTCGRTYRADYLKIHAPNCKGKLLRRYSDDAVEIASRQLCGTIPLSIEASHRTGIEDSKLHFTPPWVGPAPQINAQYRVNRAFCFVHESPLTLEAFGTSIYDELLCTIFNHDVEACEKLLSELTGLGMSVDSLDLQHTAATSRTPDPLLSYATRLRRDSIVKQLLKHGADVHVRGDDQQTPLHYACRNADKSTAQILIDYAADLEAIDSDGDTPLRVLLFYHDAQAIDTLKVLLAAGADAKTALRSWDAESGDAFQILDLLIDAGADVNIDSGKPLYQAVRTSTARMVDMLLGAGARTDLLTDYHGWKSIDMSSDRPSVVQEAAAEMYVLAGHGLDVEWLGRPTT